MLGNTREYRDESRDCARRARIAALFVALIINPGGADRATDPAGAAAGSSDRSRSDGFAGHAASAGVTGGAIGRRACPGGRPAGGSGNERFATRPIARTRPDSVGGPPRRASARRGVGTPGRRRRDGGP